VARIMRRHKELKRVRVEGHTDSSASDQYNDRLSQRRANAVREYLSNQAVDEARLDAVGFGEKQPIESNETKAGRAKNRRVQFIIVERSGEGPEGEQVETDAKAAQAEAGEPKAKVEDQGEDEDEGEDEEEEDDAGDDEE
jgi:hypothetical protein